MNSVGAMARSARRRRSLFWVCGQIDLHLILRKALMYFSCFWRVEISHKASQALGSASLSFKKRQTIPLNHSQEPIC